MKRKLLKQSKRTLLKRSVVKSLGATLGGKWKFHVADWTWRDDRGSVVRKTEDGYVMAVGNNVVDASRYIFRPEQQALPLGDA